MSKAWVFGSRSKGKAKPESDLDLAIKLEPKDGEVLSEWISSAKQWREELRLAVGPVPKIHLELYSPEADTVVFPSVTEHGQLIFERGTAPCENDWRLHR
ncbi:nucleotidyltransferase domain-containing protein [Pseudooceanicola sp. HF7]|nr:nucleotidyltransferase domain-containing protein [Pseudooceanicola sp. HF7]